MCGGSQHATQPFLRHTRVVRARPGYSVMSGPAGYCDVCGDLYRVEAATGEAAAKGVEGLVMVCTSCGKVETVTNGAFPAAAAAAAVCVRCVCAVCCVARTVLHCPLSRSPPPPPTHSIYNFG